AEYVAGRSDRFVALGSVPMQDGHLAAEELGRVMKMSGMKGVQILTTIGDKEISDPSFEPFWTKAEETNAVVLLHPNGFTQGQRLKNHYYNNVIGNPLETTMAIHNLIFDGVLERHPKLKIVVVHGGGYVGGYAGRMDHAWGARGDAKAGLPKPPTSYFKQLYFDTVVFTYEQLEALVRLVGVDHVVMGTDYPFDMADSDPVGHVANSALDKAAIGAICGGNAKKLLNL
ncbi:MAG TPA: amidohydrolase family protein, partial [Stellaceae bacterium]|nr:amidohydrolase family protein [Stellaceae bacterium]